MQLDQYTLNRKLGEGFSAEVFQARGVDGTEYAIKMFDLENPDFSQRAFQLLKEEVEACNQLDHLNIVKLHAFQEESRLLKKNGTTKRVAYIVQEMIHSGELFDYIANSGAFPVHVCKFYFKQLLQGIFHMYSKGFSHRDLKPENILLDADYNIKIVDFGFACKITGRDGTGFNKSKVGTPGYMAPEVLARKPYQGHVADIFSLGVILFAMYAGHPPFETACPKDSYYQFINNNRIDLFWQKHEKYHEQGFFSEDFKDLMTHMLQVKPYLRPSIVDLIGHSWLQDGDTATHDQAFQEMARRCIVNKAQKQMQQCNEPPQNREVRRAFRSVMPGRLMKEIDPENVPAHGVYSTAEPYDIIEEIKTFLNEKKIQHEAASDAWKVNFSVIREQAQEEDDSEDEENEDILVEQSKIQIVVKRNPENESVNFVQFKRKGGSSILFNEQCEKLRKAIQSL